MAVLDKKRGAVVVRIAYDGPALAGKTTTLRSLAGSLGGKLFSGEEAEGRTLYFDWLEYTGGRFEGYAIRCQIISVPGQISLRSRRKRILHDADSIVFVADSRSTELSSCARLFESLADDIATGQPPAAGVVVQVNKRDAANAAKMADVEKAFAASERFAGGCAFMQSVASQGVGVRETFIFAVRLALDRARVLMKSGLLAEGPPDIESGEGLLDAMKAAEAVSQERDSTSAIAPQAFMEALAAENALETPAGATLPPENIALAEVRTDPATFSIKTPDLPSEGVPGGMIWPPIGGRITLQSALAAIRDIKTSEEGSALARGGEWVAASSSADRFRDSGEARRRLLEWARAHSVTAPRLSPRRCIVAASNGPQEWRLWQFVRNEKSLRTLLLEIISDPAHDGAMRRLFDLSLAFADAHESYRERGLDATVDALALLESGLVYTGFAPPQGFWSVAAAASSPRRSAETVIRDEFAPALAAIVANADVPRLLTALSRVARDRGAPRIGEVLAHGLIGH